MKKSYKTRLYVSFVFIWLIPILLLTIFDYIYVYRSTVNNIDQYTKSNLKIAAQLLDSDLATFNGIVNNIYTNEEVSKIIKNDTVLSKKDFNETQKLYSITQIAMSGLPEKVPIHIVNQYKQSRYSTTNYFLPYYIDKRGNLYDSMDEKAFTTQMSNQVHWRIDGENSQDISFVIGKAIVDVKRNEIVGYVILDIFTTYFQKIFDMIESHNIANVLLLDHHGVIISDKKNLYYPGLKFNSDGKMSVADKEGVYNIRINQVEYKAYYTSAAVSQLKVIQLIPRSYFVKTTFTNIRSHIMVFILLIILGAVTIVNNVKSIISPVKQLDAAMNQVRQGDYSAQVEIYGVDEFARLGQSFNNMTLRIQQLINEVYEQQFLLHKAEMKSLKAQVNPHFLYNCLNSINMMAIVGEKEGVIKMTKALSKYYRNRVSTETEFVTIGEELEQVYNYLDIQMIRYKDKLTVIKKVEEAVLNKKILKLILQPLVENAIIHGIEQKIGKGRIMIRAFLNETGVTVQIIDDGAGFGSSHAKGEHTGISNTQLRLNYYYGDKYKFNVRREEGYTIVECMIEVE